MFTAGNQIGMVKLNHGGGVNSQLDKPFFNAQDPRVDGRVAQKGFRKREQYHHRTIACMSVNGCTAKEIAGALGLTEGNVQQILRQPYAQAAMIDMQQQAGVDEIKRLIQEGSKAVVRVAARAKDTTVDVNVRQRDDHCLVRSLTKVVSPENMNRSLVQLTDDELAQILIKQGAVEVESNSVEDYEQAPEPVSQTHSQTQVEEQQPELAFSLAELLK